MIPRLQELKDDYIIRARATGPPSFKYLAEGRVQGYKMALENLKAVLERAQFVIASWTAKNIEGVDKDGIGNGDLRALREELERLEEEMAHLATIPTYKCGRCGKKATKELINNHSSGLGWYCQKCGERALAKFISKSRGE